MSRIRNAAPLLFVVLVCGVPARAQDAFERRLIERAAASLGITVDSTAFEAPKIPTATPRSADGLAPESERVNFRYGEMDNRLETARRVIRSSKKRKRVVPTGMVAADRVTRGEIKYIVIHSSLGTYSATIRHLLANPVAAHFVVGAEGQVTRMVDISDLANHLKNDEIELRSVGIETETGILEEPFYVEADWEPRARWRMYAGLAWLIRAIAKEAKIPRDRDHIITHGEADHGIAKAHIDPGPWFDSHPYQAFEEAFPGEAVTPREFLMRLVGDDAPPQIWSVAASGVDGGALARVEAVDTERLGISRLTIWKLDARGNQGAKQSEWTAPLDALPPATISVPIPPKPGAYRVEARDLVGNITRSRLRVEPAPDPNVAWSAKVPLTHESDPEPEPE